MAGFLRSPSDQAQRLVLGKFLTLGGPLPDPPQASGLPATTVGRRTNTEWLRSGLRSRCGVVRSTA
jgi:hypothetical protein